MSLGGHSAPPDGELLQIKLQAWRIFNLLFDLYSGSFKFEFFKYYQLKTYHLPPAFSMLKVQKHFSQTTWQAARKAQTSTHLLPGFTYISSR